jgi:hypothetical protein
LAAPRYDESVAGEVTKIVLPGAPSGHTSRAFPGAGETTADAPVEASTESARSTEDVTSSEIASFEPAPDGVPHRSDGPDVVEVWTGSEMVGADAGSGEWEIVDSSEASEFETVEVEQVRSSRAFPGRAPRVGSEAEQEMMAGTSEQGAASSRAFPGRAVAEGDEAGEPAPVADAASGPESNPEPEATPARAARELVRFRPSRSYPGGHWAPRPDPTPRAVAGADDDAAD